MKEQVQHNRPLVAFITLGCAKNEVDTSHMCDALTTSGFVITNDVAQADAVVVNTCSFIQSATEESLEAIFDAAGLPNVEAGAPLIVAGCMPARYGDDLADELTEAQAFVPCSREDDIVRVLAQALGRTLDDDGVLCENGVTADAACVATEASKSFTQASAYLKISDGCDRYCSYCTIPYIRGRYHSFPYEQVYAEAERLVAHGARELVLIAQDTGRWGADFAEPLSLAWLVAHLAEAFPETWVRVMYIQPEGITDELLDVVATHDNVCSYFDIPLQHVDATLLQAMNRTGSRAEFEALVEHIRERVPHVTLRTTLIAGFPGETEAQFEDLYDFVSEGLFDYVGVFPYSREEGTRAFDLPQQLEEDEKIERAQRLRDVADAASAPRVAARIGQTFDVLVEGREEDGQLFGRAMCQAPEVDGVVYVSEGEPGQMVHVTVVDTLMYEMEAE